jgi:protein SCO1/2
MARNFTELQEKLSASGGPTNWHLLTISFDPEFDTPAVLKSYAGLHQYDPAHWNFATGSITDVTAFGEQLGLRFTHDPGGGITHNLRTVVVDASGRLQHIFSGNSWTSDDLAAQMRMATTVGRQPP